MQTLQEKIQIIVKDYKSLYAGEFKAFEEGMREKRELQGNKFSEIKGSQYVERAILEYPENLFGMLKIRLEDEDWKEFETKKFTRWFAKKYPEFSIAEKI